MTTPSGQQKIYHIIHVDRLASVIADECLSSDAVMVNRQGTGTTIGMGKIKERRLHELHLSSHPDLLVGQCVPFYFCPRSVMLYIIWRANHPDLAYRGGQGPIVHLEADLQSSVAWAERQQLRWAFTLSNAGSYYFEDRCDLRQLHEVNWEAVAANQWQGELADGKQAEFLVEGQFPWHLVERIGVHSMQIWRQVNVALRLAVHRPVVEVRPDWYY